jgi:hypothetical protein
MQKSIVSISFAVLLSMLLIIPNAFAGNGFHWPKLKQVTYLMQKVPVDGPWEIVLPSIEKGELTAPYGRLDYFNYAYKDMGFCFSFSGYGIPGGVEYALVYYVDPPDGAWDPDPANWPEVYVLGIAEAWQPHPRLRYRPGHRNFKIRGCCDIESIPVAEDTNYPNGGKLWLIPTDYISEIEDGACTWKRMAGWPADVSEILFETSLITYGFVNSPEAPVAPAP